MNKNQASEVEILVQSIDRMCAEAKIPTYSDLKKELWLEKKGKQRVEFELSELRKLHTSLASLGKSSLRPNY